MVDQSAHPLHFLLTKRVIKNGSPLVLQFGKWVTGEGSANGANNMYIVCQGIQLQCNPVPEVRHHGREGTQHTAYNFLGGRPLAHL